MFKHNKKRNSFIVYEQFSALVTRLIINNHKDEANKVIKIIKEYYSPKREIGKEYRILKNILTTTGIDPSLATGVIEEEIKGCSAISIKKLEKEKTALIEYINKNYSKNFFNIPIKDYKLAASLQVLINETIENKYSTTPVERVKIKKLLTERISAPAEKETNQEIDNLTFAILLNKFNKKYSQLIKEDQGDLLKIWIQYLVKSKDPKVLNEEFDQKVQKISLKLSSYLGDSQNIKNKELIKEAHKNLNETEMVINEENIYKLMRYFDLIEDLFNDQKN